MTQNLHWLFISRLRDVYALLITSTDLHDCVVKVNTQEAVSHANNPLVAGIVSLC